MRIRDIKEIVNGRVNTDYWTKTDLSRFIDSISMNQDTRKSLTTVLREIGSVELPNNKTEAAELIYDLVIKYLKSHQKVLVIDTIDSDGIYSYLVKSRTGDKEIYPIASRSYGGIYVEGPDFKWAIFDVLEIYNLTKKSFMPNTLEFASFLENRTWFYKLDY